MHTSFYDKLHTYLIDAASKPFEDTSTHYLMAWSTEFDMPNGKHKKFAVAVHDMFIALSNSKGVLTHGVLMERGCPQNALATSIFVAFGGTEIDYKTFATRLATLHSSHIQILINLFYSNNTLHDNATSTSSFRDMQTSIANKIEQKKSLWRKYKCICVFPNHKRTRWY